MPFLVHYSYEALTQLQKLRTFDSAAIVGEIEQVLVVNPTTVSKAKVKRLRQPAPTQYRLRVGDFRVFYDVDESNSVVEIVQVLSKEDAIRYLKENP